NSDPNENRIYEAQGAASVTVPLVVLIDGDTASAAEVLAGALKENDRARLVGKNSFGKGCTQRVFKLPPGPGGVPTGGVRLTITRFYSPTGQPYSGRGVAPHLVSERGEVADQDLQLADAVREAQRLVQMGQKSAP